MNSAILQQKINPGTILEIDMKKLPNKRVLILCAALALIVVAALNFGKLNPHPVRLGVTFTPRYAKYLKLDWQKTYIQLLDNLHVKNLRLPSYWDSLEPERGQYNFAETDYMLAEAVKRNVKVILVVGVRQPRWPECHIPVWAKGLPLDQRQQKALEIVQKVVERYQDNQSVWAWQVENEPLLKSFGEGCQMLDMDFLKNEVALVRSKSNKPIVMTDSGELGFWITPMQMSDIFGTTVYRQVYDKLLGYMTYPVPASFYSLKSNLVRDVFANNNRKTIIVELQAEPWLANGNFPPAEQQAKLFTPEDFKNYINFAGKTGFDEAYLWGSEWWYFMAEHGHPEYLNFAKTLFR